MDVVAKMHAVFGEELRAVDAVIASTTSGKFELIFTITYHLIQAGGKRLRPMLTLVCARLFGYTGDRHIALAAVVEFIHSATLLHDDVVDESALRRGQPTASHLWGNQASVLVGDFLLSQAFQLMVKDGSLEVLELLSRTAGVIAEGEVRQLGAIHEIQLSMEEYSAIIAAKTAELFAASCQIGAMITHQPPEIVEAMRQYGLNLGIAFQMVDDCLDYYANAATLGKKIGDDFREGKMTLPMILLYQVASADEKRVLEQIFSDPDYLTDAAFTQVLGWMQHYAIAEAGRTIAESYCQKAEASLALLPSSEFKDLLIEMLAFSVQRLY